MKKKKILSVIIVLLLIFSCTNQNNNQKNISWTWESENISENKEINSPSFKHNNLKDEEKCFILSKDFDFRKIWEWNYTFEEVFFSKSENNCFAVISHLYEDHAIKWQINQQFILYKITTYERMADYIVYDVYNNPRTNLNKDLYEEFYNHIKE